MTEISRLLGLLSKAVDGEPYYGPSAFAALHDVDALIATARPIPATHSIWEIVAHVVSELRYSAALIDGSAAPWIAGETTWPKVSDISPDAWDAALKDLSAAHEALAAKINQCGSQLDEPIRGWPFSIAEMIEGSVQHVAYHVGQVVLLKRLARARC